MKVITIGTDKKLFDAQSAVLARQMEYAKLMEEMHIVVCTSGSPQEVRHIGNLHIYPTNSATKLMWILDAYSLGKKIIVGNKFVRGASVISTQDPFESGIIGYLLSRKFRLPFQIQIHTDFFNSYFKNSFLLNRIRLIIAKFVVPRAAGIRVVSDELARLLRENFPNLKTIPGVLPIFVDIDKIANAPIARNIRKEYSQFNFLLFMASRLTREKEIETALHALKEVIGEFPHTGLIISGEGPEKNHLKHLANTLGLAANVIFIPWQDDVISIYKSVNIFLLTSRYEGYGMTLIEAGAAGVPVIATPVGIAPKIIIEGETGLMCPIGDVHCVAKGIRTLISDNSKRELYKRALQDSIRRMATSPDQYVAQYVQLLKNLL